MSVRKRAYNGYVIFLIILGAVLFHMLLIKVISGELGFGTDGDIKKMANLKDLNKYKKHQCADLGYQIIHPEKEIKNLKLIGFETQFGVSGRNKIHQLYGKIARCLRFQNITQKVEKKYGLPKNILLAIMMQETGGIELLPNSDDDGGIGLIHMQPSTAVEFGLRTYENCKDLRNTQHGKKLRNLIKKHNYKTKELIYFDDRFHPVINIDAVGRMLAYYMGGNQLEDTRLKTAIKRYAGKYNYSDYFKNVSEYRKRLKDKDLIETVKFEFNSRNTDLTIGGMKADFDGYIKYYSEMNINFGLNEYQ